VDSKEAPWTLQVPPGADVDPLERPLFEQDAGEDILSMDPEMDPSLRAEVRRALDSPDSGIFLGEEALPLLETALEHPRANPAQVERLVEALSHAPTERVMAALRRVAESPLDDARQMALVVLWERRDEEALQLAVQALLEGGPKSRPRARGILLEAGQEADRFLIRSLRHTETGAEARQLQILGILSGRPVDGALHPLLDLLQEGTASVRRAAVRALSFWAGAPPGEVAEAIVSLRSALQDPSPEVRSQAALALLDLGATDVIPALVERMQDDDESVRRATRRSLAGLCGTDAGGSYYAWKRFLEENHEEAGSP
jgi:HEAT repeat protein